jgi:uncharacterized protein YbaP (TraB family)
MNCFALTSSFRAPVWFLSAIFAFIITAASAKAEPSMWVIRDKDSTIYLIGTMHALRHGSEWSSAKIKKAAAESTELWLEVADVDDGEMFALQYGMDLEKSLSTKLNQKQEERLGQVAATYGIPRGTLDPMKPWMVAMLITVVRLQKAGYDGNVGVDQILKAQAERQGEKIFGFETAEAQVRFFADLPEPEQIAFLEQTLDEAENGLTELEMLAKAWMDGDDNTITDILVNDFRKQYPALYTKLIVQRNIAWSEKIVEILRRSGVQEVAVGAAHLVGPDSVQAQLAKRGIRVERY